MKIKISVRCELIYYILLVLSIKCYQCSSTEDQKKPSGLWSKERFTQDRSENRWSWKIKNRFLEKAKKKAFELSEQAL